MIENKTIKEEIEQWMENHRAAVLIYDASIEDWEKNQYLEQRERSRWIKRGKKISRNTDGDEEERREAERRKEERRCQVSKFSYLKELVITKVSLLTNSLPFTSEVCKRAKNIIMTKYGKPSESECSCPNHHVTSPN